MRMTFKSNADNLELLDFDFRFYVILSAISFMRMISKSNADNLELSDFEIPIYVTFCAILFYENDIHVQC